MIKTVSAYEARTKLGELLNEVYYNNTEIIIEKMGKPTAKLVSCSAEERKPKNNNKERFMGLAGVWANEGGDIIEKYAKKLRKTAKLTRF